MEESNKLGEGSSVRGKSMTADKLGIDVDELVEIYKAATNARDETFASRITAEAVASESTALNFQAAESIATIAADAVARLSR